MHRGYIKIWRKLSDSGLIQLPNTLSLFIFILINATHKDIKVGTNTGAIDLKRGQYISGLNRLSNELKQSVRQIRTSLDRLEKMEILTTKATNKYSVYTIVNYDNYQDNEIEATSKTTNKRQTNDKQTTTKQEHKNIRTEINMSDFEDFYSIYPRKEKRVDAEKSFHKLSQLEKLKLIDDVKRRNIKNMWPDDKKFIPMASTFINQKRWNDEIEVTGKINSDTRPYL